MYSVYLRRRGAVGTGAPATWRAPARRRGGGGALRGQVRRGEARQVGAKPRGARSGDERPTNGSEREREAGAGARGRPFEGSDGSGRDLWRGRGAGAEASEGGGGAEGRSHTSRYGADLAQGGRGRGRGAGGRRRGLRGGGPRPPHGERPPPPSLPAENAPRALRLRPAAGHPPWRRPSLLWDPCPPQPTVPIWRSGGGARSPAGAGSMRVSARDTSSPGCGVPPPPRRVPPPRPPAASPPAPRARLPSASTIPG